MAYKINRKRGYGKKKKSPLLASFFVIFFCVAISLGLAALWQNSGGNHPVDSSRKQDSLEESSASDASSQGAGQESASNASSTTETVPYDYSKPVPESTRVNTDYFNDALFVGDSITAGIQSYSLMKNAEVVAFTGINTDTIMSREVIRNDAGELETMPKAISRHTKAQKIYVMLGANGIGWIGKESFIKNYGIFLDAIRESHPDADIYVQSILPVTASKEKGDEKFANSKIRDYNAALQQLAEEKQMYYLNVAEALEDENGCLPEEASPTDGMHFGPKYYEIWFEYLKQHVADGKTAAEANA